MVADDDEVDEVDRFNSAQIWYSQVMMMICLPCGRREPTLEEC